MEILGSVNCQWATPGHPRVITVAFYQCLPHPPCRIAGFRLSLGSLALLTILGALGIANSFLDEYLDLNVAKKLRHF